MWIAFKKLVSLLFETTWRQWHNTCNSCELLSKNLYLCSLKQLTCNADLWSWGCELLSKNLYLCSLKQLSTIKKLQTCCCELLSKNLYLCSLKQHVDVVLPDKVVVNCFQKTCIFALWNNTTAYQNQWSEVVNCFQKTCIFALWNNIDLKGKRHPMVVNCFQKTCIFALWNNAFSILRLYRWVVNCFQKTCIFALWNNLSGTGTSMSVLWIAFKKLVSLLFETTDICILLYRNCCELLSKNLYLCSLKQLQKAMLPCWRVVNCFQKTCIFALWNNSPPWSKSLGTVVNCFQKTCIFALWNN